MNCFNTIGVSIFFLSVCLFADDHVTPNHVLNETMYRANPHTSIRYSRKSIASIDSVLFLNQSTSFIDPVYAKKLFDKEIRLKRFDYNPLPSVITDTFVSHFSQSGQLDEDTLKQLIYDHMVDPIKTILMDPKIQQVRLNQLKPDQDYTFAGTKGKSVSVTVSDLYGLFNSAFFYVPYIVDDHFESSIIEVKDKKTQKTKVSNSLVGAALSVASPKIKKVIEAVDEVKKVKRADYQFTGGLLWYRFSYQPNGEALISPIAHFTTKVSESKTFSKDLSDEAAAKILFEKGLFLWTQSMVVKTKALDYFNIVGTVESNYGYQYSLGVFETEGIQLDDFYWLMEDVESKSDVRSRKIGLSFISKVGSKSSLNMPRYSYAKQVYGSKDHLVSWVKEAPKFGVDMGMSFLYKSGFVIDPQDSVLSLGPLFNHKVTSAYGVSGLISLNLGQFGLSQTFLDVEGSLSLIFPELNYGSVPYLIDYYMGLRKSYWVQKTAVQPYLRLGEHVFYVHQGNHLDYFRLETFLVKLGISIERMIYPFLFFQGNAFMSFGFNPEVSYETNVSSGSYRTQYSDLNSIGVSLGLKYVL